jgi:hypothetical protein
LAGKTFSEYKKIIMDSIIADLNLVKALTINDENFLEKTIPIAINDLPKEIPYNYVYPYKANPDIIANPKTIILMHFANFKFDGVKLQQGKVYFYTICHESLIRTDVGNRYDFIYEELKTLFNNNEKLGIGKAKIIETNDLPISKSLMGNYCCLEITDFGV